MDTDVLIDATRRRRSTSSAARSTSRDATAARGERLGLDVFMFYCLGRGGVLGDVDAHDGRRRVRLVQAVARSRRCGTRAARSPTPSTVADRLPRRRPRLRAPTFKETDVARARSATPPSASSTAAPHGPLAARRRLPPLRPARRRASRARSSSSSSCASFAAARTERRSPSLGITPAESHYLNSADAFELYGYETSTTHPTVTDELVERRALAEDRATELLVADLRRARRRRSRRVPRGRARAGRDADVDVEDVAD